MAKISRSRWTWRRVPVLLKILFSCERAVWTLMWNSSLHSARLEPLVKAIQSRSSA